MRILFLSDNYPPETNAPASRLSEHARHWIDAGAEVRVLTTAPNFPAGVIFPGYDNRWWRLEEMDGVQVGRVKTYVTANSGFLKRTLDYISFGVAGLFAGLLQPRPDVICATTPQFFCALFGLILAKLRRVPFVLELRDLWPESIRVVGAVKHDWMLRPFEWLETLLYRYSDRIVTVTESFAKRLIARGVDPNKIDVVINGVELDRYAPQPRDAALAAEAGTSDRFVVGYVGTHGMAHALDNVLAAAALLRPDEPITFLLVGDGARRQALMEQAQQQGLNHVAFLPPQPKARMPAVWSLCDVALVHLKDDPLFETVIPSKIFEAMGMGLPQILALPQGEGARLALQAGWGCGSRRRTPRRWPMRRARSTKIRQSANRWPTPPLRRRRDSVANVRRCACWMCCATPPV
ncbi:glycosyltransferase family 4 protein [Magnetofaba australis]|uniref:Putative glycosyltransferase n=1 Tax=Magnetofaba australis IT-1 TaxID=1434232 RepID=A0A1Y2K5H9_9PROT|nr:glycosyltransferase family 4 protein [Magnetofaba australis]OSM02364.1 putative glycosyltransferase [Magnetofaba australis IT-1]